MSDMYPVWYPVQIRFRDLDPLAHVNNTVYFIGGKMATVAKEELFFLDPPARTL